MLTGTTVETIIVWLETFPLISIPCSLFNTPAFTSLKNECPYPMEEAG